MNDAPHASGVVPRTTSGLDYLQKIIRGEIPGVPIGSTLGFRLTEAEKGRVVLLGKPDLGSYNLLNSVHGGWGAAMQRPEMRMFQRDYETEVERAVLALWTGVIEASAQARALPKQKRKSR